MCIKLVFLFPILLLMVSACASPVADIPSASHTTIKNEIRHEAGFLLEKELNNSRRLIQVAAPILIHNVDLCPRKALSVGFTAISDFDIITNELRYVAYEAALLQKDATVLAVFKGTQAWDAGLRPGDILLTMNGKRVNNAANLRARLKKMKKDKDVTFGFIRAGQSFEITLKPFPICNYKLEYIPWQTNVNAYTNGKKLFFYQGTLDFASDDELAFTVGHELAHAIMHHTKKMTHNAIIGQSVGIVLDQISIVLGTPSYTEDFFAERGANAWSQAFEKEADYVGLYLLARAGGNIDVAAPYWRKLTALYGVQKPDARHSHPSHPERFVVLDKTAQEIKEKIRNDEPLMPNLKRSWRFGEKYYLWEDDEIEDDVDDDDLNH